MARYYYLGPWQTAVEPGGSWTTPQGQQRTTPDQTVFVAPPGTFAGVDLRPPNGTGGYGFFVTDRPLGSDYTAFGDGVNRLEDLRPTAQQRGLWASMLNLPTIEGVSLLDLLWNTLTVNADPLGETGPLPLRPDPAGLVNLHLAGHSRVRSQSITKDHPSFGVLRRSLQRQFKKIRNRGRVASAAQWLEVQRRKLRLTDEEATNLLIPAGMKKIAPAKPSTKITDDFTRAEDDYATLGAPAEGWSWFSGGWWSLVGAAYWMDTGAWARAEVDLGSDDMYVQVKIMVASGMVICAMLDPQAITPATEEFMTCYYFGPTITAGQTSRLYKLINGQATRLSELGGPGEQVIAAGDTIKLSCVGGQITPYRNGVAVHGTIIDSSIDANQRAGVRGFLGTPTFDDFVAEDVLAAEPTTSGVIGSLRQSGVLGASGVIGSTVVRA